MEHRQQSTACVRRGRRNLTGTGSSVPPRPAQLPVIQTSARSSLRFLKDTSSLSTFPAHPPLETFHCSVSAQKCGRGSWPHKMGGLGAFWRGVVCYYFDKG